MKPTVSMFLDVLGPYLPLRLIEECYLSICHNDSAHNVEHIYAVVNHGIELVNRTDKKYRFNDIQKSMVLAGCLMHDLGCRYNRKNHHYISYGMAFRLLDQFAKELFTQAQKDEIAVSCLEHRASWKEGCSTITSCLVALSDRGKPDLNTYILRSLLFRMEQPYDTDIDLIQYVYDHLKDKISTNGYMWKSYPEMGWLIYPDEIERIMRFVDDDLVLNARIIDVLEKVKDSKTVAA